MRPTRRSNIHTWAHGPLARGGGPGAAGATVPRSLVKIPTDTFPIRFSEAHVKIQCDQPGS